MTSTMWLVVAYGLLVTIVAAPIALAQECVPPAERVDCHPDLESSEARCLARGCLWCPDSSGIAGVPWCHVKPSHGYSMESLIALPDDGGFRVQLRRASLDASYFGGDFDLLTATVNYESDTRLRIKIEPFGVNRYEVPLPISPPPSPPGANGPLYDVTFLNATGGPFALQVRRRSSGAVIFDTSLGGLIFSDQFIQLGIRLPSTNVYGLGENEQHTYRQSFEGFDTYPFFARGHNTAGNTNLYGVHPYYTVVENDGHAHSVMILNSNAQEFVKTPAPGYVYRTIGGLLDIYIFLGPTPEETAQQFTQAIGRAPIPPYWALGFQLCRFGYDNLANMQRAVDRTAQYGIPHDVQYGDIDIMDRRLDFTYDPVNFAGLPEYVTELKAKGIKFVTILDPPISTTEPNYKAFELGQEMDVWVKKPNGDPFKGRLWPEGPTYFPDFSRNSTREWWVTLVSEFHDLLAYDGLWIDMNEPQNFADGDVDDGPCSNGSLLNYPPYVPPIADRKLIAATLCMDAVQDFGIHYNVHSLYGWSMSEPTLAGVRAGTGKRSLVLTRSSFLGVGSWAAHWLGDNYSTWEDLGYSIIGMLQWNLFGVPFIGPDICGHNYDAPMELCTRWHQVGAFYPFSRNHNGYGSAEQDPGAYGEYSANSTRNALLVRYTLLPYLYTLFYEHVKYGGTVARALWNTFPNDTTALGVDRQFMWGDGLLVSPALQPAAITVSAYFPTGPPASEGGWEGRWYNYYTGAEVVVPAGGGFVTLGAPLDFINVHVHGGRIIPTQEPAVNTELSRQNPFGLIVPLGKNGIASGRLYVDDGNSVDPQVTGDYFEVAYYASQDQQGLASFVSHWGYNVTGKVLDTVRIMGHTGPPVSQVTVNGGPHTEFSYDATTKEIMVTGLGLRLDEDLVLFWA